MECVMQIPTAQASFWRDPKNNEGEKGMAHVIGFIVVP
jgi:hypothetical protein